MKVHDLSPPEGSNKRKKRVARGIARQGWQDRRPRHQGPEGARNKVPVGFEGGQMPLPSGCRSCAGSTTRSASSTRPSTWTPIAESGLTEVTPETLLAAGLVSKGSLVKILGRGELAGKVNVSAHGFSKSAEAAITAAGGTVTVLPKPLG